MESLFSKLIYVEYNNNKIVKLTGKLYLTININNQISKYKIKISPNDIKRLYINTYHLNNNWIIKINDLNGIKMINNNYILIYSGIEYTILSEELANNIKNAFYNSLKLHKIKEYKKNNNKVILYN
jgi:hypothetical protein